MPAPRHTPEELHAWLRFSLEPGLNAAGTVALLTALGLPDAIYRASATTLARHVPLALAQQIARPPDAGLAAAIDAATRWADAPGHHVLTLADRDYPATLLSKIF